MTSEKIIQIFFYDPSEFCWLFNDDENIQMGIIYSLALKA